MAGINYWHQTCKIDIKTVYDMEDMERKVPNGSSSGRPLVMAQFLGRPVFSPGRALGYSSYTTSTSNMVISHIVWFGWRVYAIMKWESYEKQFL